MGGVTWERRRICHRLRFAALRSTETRTPGGLIIGRGGCAVPRYGGMTDGGRTDVFWVTFRSGGPRASTSRVWSSLEQGGGYAGGLRGSVRLASLAATLVGVVIVTEGLWRLALWRPKRLPPTWMEPAFVTIKLTVLYAVAVAVATFVLGVHRRAAGEPPVLPR